MAASRRERARNGFLDPRADDLIDDFKGMGTNPDLAIVISVDMLDTGIDVPEIVNLVYARPVFSFVNRPGLRSR